MCQALEGNGHVVSIDLRMNKISPGTLQPYKNRLSSSPSRLALPTAPLKNLSYASNTIESWSLGQVYQSAAIELWGVVCVLSVRL